jgi:hypothetical protein
MIFCELTQLKASKTEAAAVYEEELAALGFRER